MLYGYWEEILRTDNLRQVLAGFDQWGPSPSHSMLSGDWGKHPSLPYPQTYSSIYFLAHLSYRWSGLSGQKKNARRLKENLEAAFWKEFGINVQHRKGGQSA